MTKPFRHLLSAFLLLWAGTALAATKEPGEPNPTVDGIDRMALVSLPRAVTKDPAELKLTVDGVERTALFYAPATATKNPAPLVFAFHGHGGGARQAARSFGLHERWPEAIVVYPQGLNTAGKITDPEGKLPGWQMTPEDQGGRDLKFFDALLARLKTDLKVDEKRIYATGHSNGGAFTYQLWAERGKLFAAFAPSAAAYVGIRLANPPPKPVLHFAGENDPLVKYAWQTVMIEAVKKINGCDPKGEPWETKATLFPSAKNAPTVTFVYPGGHEYHKDAPELIVKFFKAHSL